jgi:hypothetical protein
MASNIGGAAGNERIVVAPANLVRFGIVAVTPDANVA